MAPACLPERRGGLILRGVTVVLVALAGLAATMAVALSTGGIRLRRYSAAHIHAQLTIAGRGLFFSHTPDGTWWRFRLRPRRCAIEGRSTWGDSPPDIGVREPRRPLGPGPLTAAAELDLSRD